MPKQILTEGKVVVVLNGRHAGQKAVVVKANNADKKRRYNNVVLAGVDRAPKPVTRFMSKKKAQRRSRIKPFIKTVNVTHVLPTRKLADKDLDLKDPTIKRKASHYTRQKFQEKHKAGESKWFFTKLRF